jgi:hypothetical protein
MRCNRVQPFFYGNKRQFVRKKIPLRHYRIALVLFEWKANRSCSEKEQKPWLDINFRLGATYSPEMGCTLFALLHSIRAQGATSRKAGVPADGFPGETSVINARDPGSSVKRHRLPALHQPPLHKNKARASLK